MKKVILTATALGQVFTQSFEKDGVTPKLDKNGKPHGYLRVENPAEASLAFAYEGNSNRGQSALVAMSVEGWEKSKNLRGADGELIYRDGAMINGRVQIIESLTKEEGMKEKTTGGENPQNLLFDGKQIFRKTVFDPTGTKEDILIHHNNELIVEKKAVAAGAEALNEPVK